MERVFEGLRAEVGGRAGEVEGMEVWTRVLLERGEQVRKSLQFCSHSLPHL